MFQARVSLVLPAGAGGPRSPDVRRVTYLGGARRISLQGADTASEATRLALSELAKLAVATPGGSALLAQALAPAYLQAGGEGPVAGLPADLADALLAQLSAAAASSDSAAADEAASIVFASGYGGGSPHTRRPSFAASAGVHTAADDLGAVGAAASVFSIVVPVTSSSGNSGLGRGLSLAARSRSPTCGSLAAAESASSLPRSPAAPADAPRVGLVHAPKEQRSVTVLLPEVAWLELPAAPLDGAPPATPPRGASLCLAEGEGRLLCDASGAGLIYRGQWRAGVRHGVGRAVIVPAPLADGGADQQAPAGAAAPRAPAARRARPGTYDGDWRLGLRHGKGVLTEGSGGLLPLEGAGAPVHVGALPLGGADGPCASGGGDRYDGCWAGDQRHGSGTEHHWCGGVYRGAWEHGLLHGVGVWTWPTAGAVGLGLGLNTLAVSGGSSAVARSEYRQYTGGVLTAVRPLAHHTAAALAATYGGSGPAASPVGGLSTATLHAVTLGGGGEPALLNSAASLVSIPAAAAAAIAQQQQAAVAAAAAAAAGGPPSALARVLSTHALAASAQPAAAAAAAALAHAGEGGGASDASDARLLHASSHHALLAGGGLAAAGGGAGESHAHALAPPAAASGAAPALPGSGGMMLPPATIAGGGGHHMLLVPTPAAHAPAGAPPAPHASTAPQPLNAGVLRLLKHTSVNDVAGGRVRATGDVLTLDTTDTVETALTSMTKNNVLSVPVFDTARERYVAVLHIMDICAFMLDLVAKKKASLVSPPSAGGGPHERAPHASPASPPPAAHASVGGGLGAAPPPSPSATSSGGGGGGASPASPRSPLLQHLQSHHNQQQQQPSPVGAAASPTSSAGAVAHHPPPHSPSSLLSAAAGPASLLLGEARFPHSSSSHHHHHHAPSDGGPGPMAASSRGGGGSGGRGGGGGGGGGPTGSLREALAHQRRFASAAVSEVLAMRDHLTSTAFRPLPAGAPLLFAAQTLAERGVHAVPIVDPLSGALVRMLTQADVIRFLAAHLDELGPLGPMSVGDLGLVSASASGGSGGSESSHHLVVARFSDRAFDILQAMRAHGAPAAPVVNAYGAICANVSFSDLKRVARSANFGVLQQPIAAFLSAIDKPLETISPSIYVKSGTQFQSMVLTLAATKIHQLYAIDDALRPVGCVRISDILALLTREDAS